MMLAKRFLHRVQLAVLRDAFDGHDIRAVCLHREHGAALHRAAIDMDHAGPALAGIAADMRPRPAKMLSDHLDEQGTGIDLCADGFAVQRARNINRHQTILFLL